MVGIPFSITGLQKEVDYSRVIKSVPESRQEPQSDRHEINSFGVFHSYSLTTVTMIPILSDRHGSFRCSTKNILFFLLVVLVAFVSGQEVYSQEDLEAMTEAELEDICVTRGFKLVNDNAEELTKQDYVEAAQRCLAIEQEM